MLNEITIRPIGGVRSPRSTAEDDHWDAVATSIELEQQSSSPTATLGLDTFSHIEVVYVFHLVDESNACRALATLAAATTGHSPASWRNERRTARTASASRPAASTQSTGSP